ncbi:MAG: hypothetical protein GY679_00610 [Mycoplasma sp.]|nr:hypothetical protein [Mycoplasma sp.]
MNFIEKIPGINNPSLFWMWFIPASLLTFLFSYKMVKYAEVIIEKTRLGGAFIGGTLISASTSLTELSTEIIQARNGTPAIGLADDIGANFFSTFAIAIASIIFFRQMFIKKLGTWTKFSIFFSMILSIIVAIVLGIGDDFSIGVEGKFVIGILPFIFFITYLIYVFLSYKYGEEDKSEKKILNISIKKGIFGFIIYSLLLLISAFFLNIIVDGMKDTYKLKSESAGGILLSMTTAMPEIVSLFVLIINKQPIAAIGSIIGSQIFNLSLIFYGDMAYTGGPIVKSSGKVWEIAIATSLMLMFLGIFAIISKKIKNKFLYILFPAIIALIYIIGWILILIL